MKISRRKFIGATAGASALIGTSSARERSIKEPQYNRLSKPINYLKNDYEVLIIGSGYGGSTLAARLAPHFKTAVLEKGKEWGPSDFPRSALKAGGEVNIGQNPLGLIEFNFNKDIEIMVGSGLGGGSLINAGVAEMPAMDIIYNGKRWPSKLKKEAESQNLIKYFERANEVFQPEFFREDKLPPKGRIHYENSISVGGKSRSANLTVHFGKKKVLENGTEQSPCHFCGDCVIGCSFGAKKSLNYNYLQIAVKNGCEIYTQTQVLDISKLKDEKGYSVKIRYYNTPSEYWDREVITKFVFLSAGTLGSTKILKSSENKDFLFSPMLGRQFSGNGDMIGVSYNGQRRTDIIGYGRNPSNYIVGPTITTIGEFDLKDLGKIWIEDGAIPSAIVGISRGALQGLKFQGGWRKISKRIRDVFQKDSKGALNHSMVLLGMGKDSAKGVMKLNENGEISVHWPKYKSEPIVQGIRKKMKVYSENMGADLLEPFPPDFLKRGGATVHPLGGCPSGESMESGVVDHLGHVFDRSGNYHEGLYVVDGSTIPESIGINPFLTITALAERTAEKFLDQNGKI